MEQPCYKCGQLVEQGRLFCPNCRAPQIRVLVEEPAVAVIGDSASVPEVSSSPNRSPSQTVLPVLAVPMLWSQALKPSALAAMVASLLMALGLNPFVAMLSVGFLSVVFYRQGRRELVIKSTTGASLGALAGLLWFAISSILEVVIVLVTHRGAEIRTQLLEKIQQASSQANDPQAAAVFNWMKSPGGLEVLMVGGIVFALIAAIILGGLGGVVAAAIFGRRRS